jgi:hypothetical protein
MDKTLLSFVLIFFIAFTIFVSSFVLRQPISQVTRAASEDKTVSANDSLIFAWPLTLKADGQDESTITVFVRNASTDGLVGKPVTLTSNLGKINETVVITNNDGKAIFHLTSQAKGLAEIEVMVDNIKIPKPISVAFE